MSSGPMDGDGSGHPPLHECVGNAIRHYFEVLGDHETSGLYQMVLAEVEPPLLREVMRHTGHNQSRAAELLGINRTTLRKKLRAYNID